MTRETQQPKNLQIQVQVNQRQRKCLGIGRYERGVDMIVTFPRVQVYPWVIWTLIQRILVFCSQGSFVAFLK